MTDTEVIIAFDGEQRSYQPGDLLLASCRIDSLSMAEPKVMEISVLWYTEGKGEEDLAVHYFERIASEEGSAVDLRRGHRFQTRLPNSPLSYDGLIVKICWCVRVRLFLARGREVVAEQEFRLGSVPGAVVPAV